MEVLTLEDVGAEAWDEFCSTSDDAWFWHTTKWLRYLQAYRPELASVARPLAVRDDEGLIAILPLMIEHEGSDSASLRIAAGGGPCWGPALAGNLSSGREESALRTLFDALDRMASELDAGSGWLRMTPLAPGFDRRLSLYLTEFLRAGWFDISLTTVVVDLSQGPEQVWRGIRKGHRADIRRAEKQLRVQIFDRTTISTDAFQIYEAMHAKAAGRVTRPKETFRLMHDWIGDGDGILAIAFFEDAPVGCSYVYTYKDGAYYGSAANDSDAPNLPVGHLLQWEIITWLCTRDFRRYEIGIQQFCPLPYDLPSAKELAISHFKRGFGGLLVPALTRERFFRSDAARHELNLRAERFSSTLP